MLFLLENYILQFYVEFIIIYKLEPHYTKSARDFTLNVRRHLVLSAGRR